MLGDGKADFGKPAALAGSFKDLIYIAETPAEWSRIARDLPRTETPALRQTRIAKAREHSHA